MTQHARIVEVLWGARQQPRRGPKPKLTLDRMVAVGIEIADAEGLAAVSMHRVAAELGYTKMSLYRYVQGKSELTAVMLEAALGSPPDLSEIDGGWRPRLHALAMRMWTALRRHPWALELAVGARVFGPNELGWLEAGLDALADTNLDGAECLDVMVLVTGHVRGLVQQAAPSADGQEEELRSALGDVLAEHGDDYPRVRAAFADSGARDDALAFGLDRIFDGLATLINRRRTGA